MKSSSLRNRLTLGMALLMAALFAVLPPATSFARGGGGGCNCGGGGGGGGGSVIDPPAGAAFKDPPVMQNTSDMPGMFEGTLEVRQAQVNVNGVQANLLTYNGTFPGPTIKVKRGDMLKLHFVNSLPATTVTNFLGFEKNHTNLHTHGLHVSPMEPADAAHLDIPAGGTYDYEYDLSYQDPGSLTFYHPHVHGLVADQYWSGLVGLIDVADETAALSDYETHSLVLKDMSLTGAEPSAHSSMMDYMQGKEGNIVMVNGQVNPVMTMRPGQVQRWKIVNASNARFYKLQLNNHTLQLIGTDGGLLDKPYSQTSILLSPGERIDILVKATSTKGSYKLLSLPYSRMGMGGGGMGGGSSAQITLMTISVKGTATNGVVPSVINPDAERLDVDTSMLPTRTLVLSMGQGRGYINGQDFDVDPYEIHSELGGYEVWEIVNQSGMDHPFHQHVNAAQVLSITGGDAAYASLYTSTPAWKDVVIVPKMGSVKILVPVMDWPGMTMFHCHIVEHEDIGMMGMWHIMGDDPMPMPMP